MFSIMLDRQSVERARIRVVGVGGAGGNAVDDMISRGLDAVEFIAINTDLQALEASAAQYKIQAGKNLTRGLGAGADPSVGYRAIEEDKEEITSSLAGSDMVFIAAGMGGGTGTGGAPVVANIAKGLGALVVGIVTKPFHFEGKRRMAQAEEGIEELRKHVDTLIVIPNQKLMSLVDKSTSVPDAFRMSNQVLYNATRGISDIISRRGIVNVDFADVKNIMKDMGDALMGSGFASGENCAIEAAHNAISHPLLEGVTIAGARGVLINFTGGPDMSIMQLEEAGNVISEAAGEDANVIFGAVLDDSMGDSMMVTVIATGFNPRHVTARRQPAAQVKAMASSRPVHIPSGIHELRDLDPPTAWRKGGVFAPPMEENTEEDQDGRQYRRSAQEKPPFLRRMMD
ncbi:MAG: cell division protein FtsZ [Bacteroidota bacterium]|nr:cell division protein FtsZ [Bacteroidota bacterium]